MRAGGDTTQQVFIVLKDIPAAARPREKLLTLGPAALADAELIALLLRTGLRGTSVLQLAQQLLDAFGGVTGLLASLKGHQIASGRIYAYNADSKLMEPASGWIKTA